MKRWESTHFDKWELASKERKEEQSFKGYSL